MLRKLVNSIKGVLGALSIRCFRDGLEKCNKLGIHLISMNEQIDRVLDTGCHDGELTMKFAQHITPIEIYGTDLIEEVVSRAAGKGIRCLKVDLNQSLPFENNFFDLIISSQIIEHLYNTRLYLEECYRCLKPGGKLLVLTENLASWMNIFSLYFGYQPFSSTSINGWKLGNPFTFYLDKPMNNSSKEEWEAGSHIRILAFQGLLDLLKQAGFKNIKIQTKGYPPFYGWLSDLFCLLDKKHGFFLISLAQKP